MRAPYLVALALMLVGCATSPPAPKTLVWVKPGASEQDMARAKMSCLAYFNGTYGTIVGAEMFTTCMRADGWVTREARL